MINHGKVYYGMEKQHFISMTNDLLLKTMVYIN